LVLPLATRHVRSRVARAAVVVGCLGLVPLLFVVLVAVYVTRFGSLAIIVTITITFDMGTPSTIQFRDLDVIVARRFVGWFRGRKRP
jgi:hypothetical protein